MTNFFLSTRTEGKKRILELGNLHIKYDPLQPPKITFFFDIVKISIKAGGN